MMQSPTTTSTESSAVFAFEILASFLNGNNLENVYCALLSPSQQQEAEKLNLVIKNKLFLVVRDASIFEIHLQNENYQQQQIVPQNNNNKKNKKNQVQQQQQDPPVYNLVSTSSIMLFSWKTEETSLMRLIRPP